MKLRSLRTRLGRALHIDGAWLRKFANLGSVHAPEWFKRSSPYGIAALTFALLPERRRAAVRNLEQVLGAGRAAAHRAALRMYAEFAFCLSESMEHYSERARPFRIDLPPEDAVLDAISAGRGAVVVTGHIGSWDIAAKVLRDKECLVHVVMAREPDANTAEFVEDMRNRAGVNVVLSEGSVFSSLGLVQALRRNEIVAIQLDRSAGTGGVRMLPFLGALAPFPSGPFVLSRLTGAPVIPVFAPRLGRRHYAIRIGRPVEVPDTARDPRVLDPVMLEVVSQLEEMIRSVPCQWFQFAPFWPEPAELD
ncbi:MAG: lysophospholipid acyltransferase family protein [Myxococcota bacterium]